MAPLDQRRSQEISIRRPDIEHNLKSKKKNTEYIGFCFVTVAKIRTSILLLHTEKIKWIMVNDASGLIVRVEKNTEYIGFCFDALIEKEIYMYMFKKELFL
jgi:hypothetical protein